MAWTGLPHSNINGVSLPGGCNKLGNLYSVLSNPHRISLASEGSYPMEEGTSTIDIYPMLLVTGNDITSQVIPSLNIHQSKRQ